MVVSSVKLNSVTFNRKLFTSPINKNPDCESQLNNSQGFSSDLNSSHLKAYYLKSNNLSFKGLDSNKNEKVDIKDTIIGGGAVAAAFLIPLIVGTAIVKHQNPDEIFTHDGMYIGNAKDLSVNTDKAKELGFDLDPSRFRGKENCVCDEVNGIYKDLSKGVDINVKEGKYIDLEKGIFVKPDEDISVIYTNGDAMPVIIPSFGSGYPTRPEDSRWLDYRPSNVESNSREEYIKEHGHTPESNSVDSQYVYSKHSELNSHDHHAYTPIDRRDIFEKAKDFFIDGSDSRIMHDYWGREIITVQDKMGQPHYVALTDKLSDIMHNHNMSYEDVQEFIVHSAEHPIENYIKENYADYLHNMHFEAPNIENFINHLDTTDHPQHTDTNHNQVSGDNPENNSDNNHGLDDDLTGLV